MTGFILRRGLEADEAELRGEADWFQAELDGGVAAQDAVATIEPCAEARRVLGRRS